MIGLISCGSAKLSHPARACDLYTGGYFKAAMAYVKARCAEWAILSARHGLLMPTQIVAPYDERLATKSTTELDEWAARARAQLDSAWPNRSFLIIGGKRYRAAVRGLPHVAPLDSLPDARFGYAMQWLRRHT